MSRALTVTNNANNLPAPSGDLTDYLSRIAEIPVLTAEEEHKLAVRLSKQNDIEAARQLVMSQLRFVVHIARSYNGYGLPLADIVQEGNIGLMKAVKRFDPDKGVRLISFAVHWIRAEIHEYVIRNWRIVKVATTKPQRKLFFKLRSSKTRLGWFTQEETQAVARDLGVEPQVVSEMEGRLNNIDATFDASHNDDEGPALSPSQYLHTENADPAALLEHQDSTHNELTDLANAMSALDERSQDILRSRWLSEEKLTLHDLAAKYGVSAERIRQIEKNAMKKIKTAILSA